MSAVECGTLLCHLQTLCVVTPGCLRHVHLATSTRAMSVGSRLYPDNIRIGARGAVIRSHPVIVERIGAQPSNVVAGRIAGVHVIEYVIHERTARGHI